MARRPASDEDWRRAGQLGDALTQRKDDAGLAVQAIAELSGLGYETVRALLSARSAGPSFFLIADLADALAVSLDDLAEASR